MGMEHPEAGDQRSNDNAISDEQVHLYPDRWSAPGSGRRSKFSNSTLSSAFAGNLQPLDEQFEDSVELDEEGDEQHGLARSHSQAVLGR